MSNVVVPLNYDICDTENSIYKPLNKVVDLRRTYLPTPYFRTIPPEISDAQVWGSMYNYTPYDKWCLNCNLRPIFSSIGCTFQLISQMIDSQMRVCIVPYKNNKPLEMSDGVYSKLYEEVQWNTANLHGMCLLFDASVPDTTFPEEWIYNVLPYCKVETKYNPLFFNGRLYISLNKDADYDREYDECHDNLIKRLSEMYTDGIIYCKESEAVKWDLSRYEDSDSLFLPNWWDERITHDPVSFLKNALQSEYLYLQIPNDNLCKHLLSKENKNYVFDTVSSTIRIQSDGIGSIKKILKIIDTYIYGEWKYTLYTFSLKSHNEWGEYCGIISRLYPKTECTVYLTEDGWVASVLLWDIDENMNNVILKEINSIRKIN
jgi:hypothetical protein